MGLTPGPTSAKSPLQSRHLLSTAILNQIVEQIPIWEPIKGKAYVCDLGYWVCALHSPYCDLAAAAAAKSLQSCPTLCDPIDGSPPHSAVPGILQARTLEWVAISFSNA